MKAQALGPGLGFPGLAILAYSLCSILPGSGGGRILLALGMGNQPGVREPATFSRPDGGRSDFSPAVFLAEWAGGQAGMAHRGHPHHSVCTHTTSTQISPATHFRQRRSSDPELVNHFGLLWILAELLECLLDA